MGQFPFVFAKINQKKNSVSAGCSIPSLYIDISQDVTMKHIFSRYRILNVSREGKDIGVNEINLTFTTASSSTYIPQSTNTLLGAILKISDAREA